jgi:hypothetical protein
MSRLVAYVFGLGLVVAVAAPGLGDPRQDSFPLSTYPMFSTKRDKPVLYFVEGVGRDGQLQRLPPEMVANDEVMQAAAAARRAVEGGRSSMKRLCVNVARRVAESAQYQSVSRIQLIGARFDPVGYFVHGPEPEERVLHFRCAVRRRR